jgi:hypothetical protein
LIPIIPKTAPKKEETKTEIITAIAIMDLKDWDFCFVSSIF